ncbi:MAG: alpha/beta hydrolase [Deltaproteobacteria bacterium]|nr:alpha/beta hydrolase [Deltaproteobacteria bacterium]
MSLLDHRIVSERYFFPRRDPPRRCWTFELPGGETLGCVRSEVPGDRWVLHFHGNGEVVADWEPLLPALFAAAGFSSLLVEYRGYGASTGQPALTAMLGDGAALVEALGLDPGRCVAFGRSIGSLYAIELCRRLPLAGLILESGIHDLGERLRLRMAPAELGATEEEFAAALERDFDHAAKLAAFTGPTLLLHARDDDLVGLHHAEANAAACALPRRCAFDEGGHNGIYFVNRDAYHAAVTDFLAEL